MTTCFGKSCSLGLMCVFHECLSIFVSVLLPLFAFGDGLWDVIVLIPDH